MRRPWHPEEVVDASLAAVLITDRWPELAPVKVESLGEGWDNTAFKVNDDLVFRFPRREVAVPLLEAEAGLLPAIAPILPLPIPVPRFVGRACDRFRWPFLGYDWLPGRTASVVHLTDDQKLQLAAPLARFLSALHAFPVERAAALGAPRDTLARGNVATRAPAALEIIAALEEKAPEALAGLGGDLRAALEDARTIVPPEVTTPLRNALG